MAKVMHSWICAGHGEFLSYSGKCVHGCSDGMVRKLMGASVVTNGKSKFIDRKTQDLARQFGDSAMNDRFDSSRIDMSSSGDIQQKRLAGQTYALPVDPKNGVASALGITGGGADPVLVKAMQQSAVQAVRSATVVHDDYSSLPKE